MKIDPAAAMADKLLEDVEPLSHPARVTAVTMFARQHKDDVPALVKHLTNVRGLHDEDVNGTTRTIAFKGIYEFEIACILALAVGDLAFAKEYISEPFCGARRTAKIAALLSDEQLEEAFKDAPASIRCNLVHGLSGRPALADRIAERWLNEFGPWEVAAALPYCSDATVRKLLPDLLNVYGKTCRWKHLVDRHPRATFDAVTDDLKAAGRFSVGIKPWWETFMPAFFALFKRKALARKFAKEALDLFIKFPPRFYRWNSSEARLVFKTFIDVDPRGAIDLANILQAAKGKGNKPCPTDLLARTRLPEAIDCVRAGGMNMSMPHHYPAIIKDFVKALPPGEERAKAYEGLIIWREPLQAYKQYGKTVWKYLPLSFVLSRAREAVATIKPQDLQHWDDLCAWLPPDENRTRFEEAIRSPEPETREKAWEYHLKGGARHGPAAFAKAIRDVAENTRNEQHTVLENVLQTLQDLSTQRSLWTPEVLPYLKAILKNAIEDEDDYDEGIVFPCIVMAILAGNLHSVPHLELATDIMRILVNTGEHITFPSIGHVRHGAEKTLIKAYKPVLDTYVQRKRFYQVGYIARSFGSRASKLPELQSELWTALVSGSSYDVKWWLDAKATRSERVEQLVNFDKSALTLPEVRRFVSTCRTDLLDPIFDKALCGHFCDDGTWHYTPDKFAPLKWTAKQTLKFIRYILGTVMDPSSNIHLIGMYLRSLRLAPAANAIFELYVRVLKDSLSEENSMGNDIKEDESEDDSGLATKSEIAHDNAMSIDNPADPEEADAGSDEWIDDESTNDSENDDADSDQEGADEEGTNHLDDEYIKALFIKSLSYYGGVADLKLLYAFANSDYAWTAVYSASRLALQAKPSYLEPLFTGLLMGKNSRVTSRKELIRTAARTLPVSVLLPLLQRVASETTVHRDVLRTCIKVAVQMLPHETAWSIIDTAAQSTNERVIKEILQPQALAIPPSTRERYGAFPVKYAFDDNSDVKQRAQAVLGHWASYTPAVINSISECAVDLDRYFELEDAATLAMILPENLVLNVFRTLITKDIKPDRVERVDRPAYRRMITINPIINVVWDDSMRATWRAVSQLLVDSGYLLQAARVFDSTVDERLPNCVDDVLRLGELFESRQALGLSFFTRNWPPRRIQKELLEALVSRGENSMVHASMAIKAVTCAAGIEGWTTELCELLYKLRQNPDPDVREVALDVDASVSQ